MNTINTIDGIKARYTVQKSSRSIFLWCCIVSASLLGSTDLHAEINTHIGLTVETGAHLSKITSVSIDASEKYAVTSSFDSSVRIWNVRKKSLEQIIRPLIFGDIEEINQESQIACSDISPSGEIIAVGGYSGVTDSGIIYFYSRLDGKLIKTISGFDLSL